MLGVSASGRFPPVAATIGFSIWQPGMLALMVEFGQEQTFDLTRCRHTVRLT
jgi:hypothetical protein